MCGRPITMPGSETCGDSCYLCWLRTPLGRYHEYLQEQQAAHYQRQEDLLDDEDLDPWGA
jgi:hypothetical protein